MNITRAHTPRLRDRHASWNGVCCASLVAAALACPAASAQTVSGGPIADLAARLAAVERRLADLQAAPERKRLIDAAGKFVGDVIFSSPSSATVEITFRGAHRKLVVNPNGATEGPSYSARFFATADCSGVEYARAARFDGSLASGFWGNNYLWRNARTGAYEFPRVGAVPAVVTIVANAASNGACFPTPPENMLAYPVSDLVTIEPLAGFAAPFSIVP